MSESSMAGHVVRGSLYSIGASAVTIGLGFVRAVLLARLLLPEHFGVVTLALFFVNLIGRLRAFGLSAAVVHKDDVDTSMAATYFTLQGVLVIGTLGILLGLIPVLRYLYPQFPLLAQVLGMLALVDVLKWLNGYQVTFLNRALAFRRLALADVVASVAMSILAPLAAWCGWGAWSLVVEQAVGQVARSLVCWIHPLAPSPRFKWDRAMVRWLWQFGSRVWVGGVLNFLLDRFDDFWVGTFLSKSMLGYYSRAYEFARYPRRLVANPFVAVFFPTFARLQHHRLLLSKAFFRVMSLIIRIDLLLSAILIVAAPQFIPLVLGERWVPMVVPFQLMIFYTFADPLTVILGNLLTATGHPGRLAGVRAVQLVIFVPLVAILGVLRGINGVAIAADIMIGIGLLLLFVQSRRLVDYSMVALWGWPLLMMTVAWAISMVSMPLCQGYPSYIGVLIRIAIMSVLYGGGMWLVEKDKIQAGWKVLQDKIVCSPKVKASEIHILEVDK